MSTPMVFTKDVQSDKNYPSFEYKGSEPGNVWHEDREIDGIMYRAANATYNDLNNFWSQIDGSQPSYAIAQNTDGSINYLYMPPMGTSTWTTWQGAGQAVIYHAVNYGMSPSASAATNQAGLQAAVNAAFATGGTVFIPRGSYNIAGTISLDYTSTPGNDNGLIIAGDSGTTELLQTVSSASMFSFIGLASGRGVRIRDLRITYSVIQVPPPTPPPAIQAITSAAVTCERVYFNNCPQALNVDNMSNGCGLLDCVIQYANYGGQVMVYFSGSEGFVDHCILKQPSQSGTNPGPVGCTGILIASASTTYISNTHISDFTIGVDIQGGGRYPLHAHFSNVNCECWTFGVKMQPLNSSAPIYQVFFEDCTFARENDSTDTTSVGIYIDSNNGIGNVSDIFINNCMCYQWNVAGIQINAGQNIVITGGRYGSNATNEHSTSGGISITGAATNVTIDGADCSPTVPNAAGGTYGCTATQK